MDVNASVDVGPNITALLEKLATQIGTTADKVFPWYIKQQVLEGWIWLGLSGSALLIGVALAIVSWGKADFEDGNRYTPLCIVGGILAICGFLFVVFGTQTAVTQIMNPNYYALKSITADMARLVGK